MGLLITKDKNIYTTLQWSTMEFLNELRVINFVKSFRKVNSIMSIRTPDKVLAMKKAESRMTLHL